MSEDGELSLRQCRSALLLVLFCCKGFRGVVSGVRLWKKIYAANHRKLGITEIQKGLFSWKFARWCQAQAEDDQLQLTVRSLAPPPRVSRAVWCRTTMKIGLKWIRSECSLSGNISKVSHQTSQTNATDPRMYVAAVNGER